MPDSGHRGYKAEAGVILSSLRGVPVPMADMSDFLSNQGYREKIKAIKMTSPDPTISLSPQLLFP